MSSAMQVFGRWLKRNGGKFDHLLTRYDHKRDGRVIEMTLFFPGHSGYDLSEFGAAAGTDEGVGVDE